MNAINKYHPSLYQVNTRVWIREISQTLGSKATLDDIPDEDLDRFAELGFDWIWFLGVWKTGGVGRRVSLKNTRWRQEFTDFLPDLKEEDICGSCFAVTDYSVNPELGDELHLGRLRNRLASRGLRLLLDFVPNHTAQDHPWVQSHPEYYVNGTALDLGRQHQNYHRVDTPAGKKVLAYGRDPNYPGWTDTFQLNYGNPDLQEAMKMELEKVARLCDGVRCDMAMLLLPEVFHRTWNIDMEAFWPDAMNRVHDKFPDFLFLAEVYWDLEWTLQQQGFDYTYDKRLYDQLRAGQAQPVRGYLNTEISFQHRSARFLENHDEPRAAQVFPPDVHKAAAVITYLVPGMRFFHQGQLEGFCKRIPVTLCRKPTEPVNKTLQDFYQRLLYCHKAQVLKTGEWKLFECAIAWEGNWTWDSFIAFSWQSKDNQRLIITVNFAPNHSQCYAPLPFEDLAGKTWILRDKLSDQEYLREGSQLISPGLYLDLPPWGYHVFEMIQNS
jgi:hypothetical protein